MLGGLLDGYESQSRCPWGEQTGGLGLLLISWLVSHVTLGKSFTLLIPVSSSFKGEQ